MRQSGQYMDMIHPGARMHRVPVQTTESVRVNVVRDVIDDVLPEPVEEPIQEVVIERFETTSQTDDFDFDKELEKAFSDVDFSESDFVSGGDDANDNIADIDESMSQMFVDESVPMLDDESRQAASDDGPDANNYSLGGSIPNPFLPGARVDKRPLGMDIKPEGESAAATKSTKNVYVRREAPSKPTTASTERSTMVVDNPRKSDHGFLWALLIVLITLLGAGAGALVYYLIYN